MSEILDGKEIAREMKLEIRDLTEDFVNAGNGKPILAAVIVGENPASQSYVRSKRRSCEKVGMGSELFELPESVSEPELLKLIEQLNKNDAINGILVQLPLPKTINELRVLDAIDPMKDVDAFHPENVGLLSQGRPRFLPCTPHGIQQMLHRSGVSVSGKHVVIIGRSDIVGKSLGLMLIQRSSSCGVDAANATVTICHSKTENLAEITRSADVVVAAIGRSRFVTSEMVSDGAVVVDVGINREENGLVGDVDFENVAPKCSYITPVPGGVGPMTVAMLLFNTLMAAKLQSGEG